MWKTLGVIVLVSVGTGCEGTHPPPPSPATRPDAVIVVVDKNGELMTGGFGLEKTNLPSFVQELHGRSVTIKPFFPALTGYDKAIAAKKELEAAGAHAVTISGG